MHGGRGIGRDGLRIGGSGDWNPRRFLDKGWLRVSQSGYLCFLVGVDISSLGEVCSSLEGKNPVLATTGSSTAAAEYTGKDARADMGINSAAGPFDINAPEIAGSWLWNGKGCYYLLGELCLSTIGASKGATSARASE